METERAGIIVRPHPGTTPEQAREARAKAWAFVFDCHHKKAAGANGGGNDPTKIEEHRADASIPTSP